MNKKIKVSQKLVAIFSLFRFATFWDWILLLVGTIASVAHGVALPISMLYFGDLANVFVNQFTSKTLANFEFYYDPVDLLDSQCFLFIDLDVFFSGFINFTARTGGVVNCSDDFVLIEPTLTFNRALTCGVTMLARCIDDITFIPEVNGFILAFGIIGVIVFLVGTVQIFSFQVAGDRQIKRIKERFFRAILNQDAKWFDNTSSGELSSRLSSDMEKIREGIGVKMAVFIQLVLTCIAGFVVGFVRDWRLTLLLLACTTFIVITVIISYSIIVVLTSTEQHQHALASAVVEEALTALRTVVAYGGEKVEADRYDRRLRDAKDTEMKHNITSSFNFLLVHFFIFLSYAIGFWFSAWLLSQQRVQAGEILTVFFSIFVGIFSLIHAVPRFDDFVTAAGASISVYDIIDQESTATTSVDENGSAKIASTIEFVGVDFAYPSRPGIPALNQFDLKIEAGQTVALVGQSGCGKTTAIQLLMRFYEISAGQLLLGGTDIRSLGFNKLRNMFGFVGQEPVLFDTTVSANIGFGKEAATMEEIERAGKDANVHEFVSRTLPDGYDTDVGQQGTQMSGGQKQRIAIARALIRNPQILLLDDATSALDSESERVVQETLDQASSGRTTIIVSHRLSTIKNADVIAFMERGAVSEFGTHDELMAKKGAYYEFCTTQYTDQVSEPAISDSEALSPKMKTALRTNSIISNGANSGGMEKADLSEDVKTTVKTKKSDISWARVWKMNLPEVPLLVLGLICAVIQGAIYPVFALLFGQVIRVFTLPFDQVQGEISLWSGTFIILAIFYASSKALEHLLLSFSGSKLTHRLRLATFKSILRQEVSWFDKKENSPYLLTARLADDANQIQGANGVQFGIFVETVTSLFMAMVISLVADQLLALVIIGFLPFLVVPGVIQVYMLGAYTSRYKRENDEAEKIAADAMNNHQTVRAFCMEEKFLDSYSKKLHSAYKFSPLIGLGYGLTYAFGQGAIFISYSITFRFGAYQSVQPANSQFYVGLAGIYTVFMALIFGFLVLQTQGSVFGPSYVKAMTAARRLFPLLDRKSTTDSASEEGTRPDHCIGEISLKNVLFEYPTRPDIAVMQDMTLLATGGKTMALVGPSGYGKSTVMALLERFYNPLAGTITMDGRELDQLNIQWLRTQIGIVFQEPVLFDRSIADNISYGANHRSVSKEEVEQAARNADIHDFIASLPLGYDTMAGGGGTQLSRGEKQRIAIARALLRDPKLLLLDEATSALDPETEREVQSVLDKAMRHRTSIVIAHRLTTISKADEIAVLKGGAIVERGSHAQLMKSGGLYCKMYLYQIGRAHV